MNGSINDVHRLPHHHLDLFLESIPTSHGSTHATQQLERLLDLLQTGMEELLQYERAKHGERLTVFLTTVEASRDFQQCVDSVCIFE